MHTIVAFSIGQRNFGVPVAVVQRSVPAVSIDSLPQAPAAIAGIVNIHGAIVPVVDLRPLLGETSSPLRLDSKFLVVRTARRTLAIIADAIFGVASVPGHAIEGLDVLLPGAGLLGAVAALPERLIYIYDVETLLSEADEQHLSAALERRAG
jgi:chemotaxis signal transduction protein